MCAVQYRPVITQHVVKTVYVPIFGIAGIPVSLSFGKYWLKRMTLSIPLLVDSNVDEAFVRCAGLVVSAAAQVKASLSYFASTEVSTTVGASVTLGLDRGASNQRLSPVSTGLPAPTESGSAEAMKTGEQVLRVATERLHCNWPPT